MSNEFIQYTKRKIVLTYPLDPGNIWYSELQDYKAGFDSPVYHITRSISWPVPEVTTGDTIWLVGQLESPWGRLPPSVDAKIVVSAVTELASPRRIRFSAGDGSKWFTLRDASAMLGELAVISKSGSESRPYSPSKSNLGQAFQSPKKIATARIINDWAHLIENTDYDFVSYRIKDGTKRAHQAVSELMKDGRSVFWDRWSLPRRLAERREQVSDIALDRILENKIKSSLVTWGIETSAYADLTSYSAREKQFAIAEGKYQIYKSKS
jgi:hypothetical protein